MTEKLKQLSASSKALAAICREKYGLTTTEWVTFAKGGRTKRKL